MKSKKKACQFDVGKHILLSQFTSLFHAFHYVTKYPYRLDHYIGIPISCILQKAGALINLSHCQALHPISNQNLQLQTSPNLDSKVKLGKIQM